MAIIKDIESAKFGLVLNGAYLRISRVITHRAQSAEPKFIVRIELAHYAKPPQSDEVAPLEVVQYRATLDEIEAQVGTEFLAKCYNWVANQPDMAGSTPA
jgi:hypothetical protein